MPSGRREPSVFGIYVLTHRRRFVAARLDAIQEVQEIGLQVCRIVGRRHTVDARSTILAGEPVGLLHPFQIDDVVQRGQRHSSFRSCQFSYPLSFRGQVCEAQGPLPCFPSTVLSSWHPSSLDRVPVSPVPRRQQVILRCYDFPLTHPRSLICFASGVHATLLGSCLAACACAPGRSEGAFRARVIVQPATQLPACSHVDVSGISQVPRRSILCLCLGPRPRPNRRSLAYCRFRRCCPRFADSEGFSVISYFGAIARLQHLLPTLQEWCCHHPCKARFRLAGWPLPGGS